MKSQLLSFALVLFITSAHAEPAPSQIFERLKTLAGNWEARRPDGTVVKVVNKLTAANTVLVETWTMSPTRESMTLYHMDDKTLIATHYCPLGNQPTLQLTHVSGSVFTFEFRSATNLPDRNVEHEHAFEIELLDKDSFRRKEIYLANGNPVTTGLTFTRAK
jgi:hypothetical protein